MFITLTEYNNTPHSKINLIRINVDHICFYDFFTREGKSLSLISLSNDKTISVNETPEEIDKLILKAEEASAFVTARAYYQLR